MRARGAGPDGLERNRNTSRGAPFVSSPGLRYDYEPFCSLRFSEKPVQYIVNALLKSFISISSIFNDIYAPV